MITKVKHCPTCKRWFDAKTEYSHGHYKDPIRHSKGNCPNRSLVSYVAKPEAEDSLELTKAIANYIFDEYRIANINEDIVQHVLKARQEIIRGN